MEYMKFKTDVSLGIITSSEYWEQLTFDVVLVVVE